MASPHVIYSLRDFAPVVKPGEYVAFPKSPDYKELAFYRVVTVIPIDNLVIPLVPRQDPTVTVINAESETYINDPKELRLEPYELLQVMVKIVNYPIKFRIGVGLQEDSIYDKTSQVDMWRDWNTPLNELVFYFTGAEIMNGQRPKYTIWIMNPWSWNIPDTSNNAPVEVPPTLAMVLVGYRYIIVPVKGEPEHYTLIPVLPFVKSYVPR